MAALLLSEPSPPAQARGHSGHRHFAQHFPRLSSGLMRYRCERARGQLHLGIDCMHCGKGRVPGGVRPLVPWFGRRSLERAAIPSGRSRRPAPWWRMARGACLADRRLCSDRDGPDGMWTFCRTGGRVAHRGCGSDAPRPEGAESRGPVCRTGGKCRFADLPTNSRGLWEVQSQTPNNMQTRLIEIKKDGKHIFGDYMSSPGMFVAR